MIGLGICLSIVGLLLIFGGIVERSARKFAPQPAPLAVGQVWERVYPGTERSPTCVYRREIKAIKGDYVKTRTTTHHNPSTYSMEEVWDADEIRRGTLLNLTDPFAEEPLTNQPSTSTIK